MLRRRQLPGDGMDRNRAPRPQHAIRRADPIAQATVESHRNQIGCSHFRDDPPDASPSEPSVCRVHERLGSATTPPWRDDIDAPDESLHRGAVLVQVQPLPGPQHQPAAGHGDGEAVRSQHRARMRGHVHAFESVPVVVTYHPAYLLRNLPEKAKAWADLCLALDVMRRGDAVPGRAD